MELRELIFWIIICFGCIFVIGEICRDTREIRREKERIMMIYVNGSPREIELHELIMGKVDSVALDLYRRPYKSLSISFKSKVYTDAKSLVVDDLRGNDE